MGEQTLPKVLIVSRNVWDDTIGLSSTLTTLFQDYGTDNIARIYIESKQPNTKCCKLFFQISEFSLVHKLFKWKTKTGIILDFKYRKLDISTNDKIAQQEDKTMTFVRKHRSIFFSFAREILWLLNGWKTKELRQFITDFNPDVIWLDGSPLILMNRLSKYVLKVSKKPSSIFLMDDVYTYKSCNNNILNITYKFFLRKQVKQLVGKSKKIFVASPKMKYEYDSYFGINSIFLTKGIDFFKSKYVQQNIHKPIKLVYLGQVIYGRIYSLISIVEALSKINANGIQMQLYIYTNNYITENLKQKLLINDTSFLMKPVSYNEVPNVISESDIVVFVESFEKKYKNIARLSFSTKLTDYLSSGKCIFAVGPEDIAPIEYLKNEDAAVVATSEEDIFSKIETLCDEKTVKRYSKKSYECGLLNHDKLNITDLMIKTLKQLKNETD